MIAQSEEPVNLPDILDINDPDAEGTIVGDELHSETCPCDGCAEVEARWEKLWAEKGDHRTPDEKYADREEAKERREKKLDHEAWLVWDRLMGEAELEQAAIEERNYQESLRKDDPDEWLLNRERALKDRELVRRERRADAYDAEATTEPDAELTFASFGQEVTLAATERLPAAFVRSDGATLLYEGRGNSFFGEPSSCKSFIGLMAVIQQLRAGRRVIWWDNEDRATSLAKRLQILDAEDLIGHEALAWRTGDMHLSPTAMAEALVYLGGGNGPGLVVVDSVTAFGCPKDGADVNPWQEGHMKPWLNAGHTSLNIDHVPKQRKDRPMGAVGSFEKLSIIKGAALYLHGIGWNAQKGGSIDLTVHKDANGELPVTQSNVASTITAEWNGPILDWTVGMPNVKPEGEDLQDELMEALDQRGSEGARGSKGLRELLKGKRVKDIDSARDELLQLGMIERVKEGRAYLYKTEKDV